jgi:hypothetical protein
MNESVTTIDKQIRSVIAEINSSDAAAPILLQLQKLKLQRLEAIRPKTYDRMLASLK